MATPGLLGDFQLRPYTPHPKELRQEIEIGKRILRSFRRSLPHARFTWIEGNHEFRLRKYLIQNARELYGLPGLSSPDIFDLKRLDIEYVASLRSDPRFQDLLRRIGLPP